MTETKGLKRRATDATREVPLSPVLVRLLRDHLKRFEAVDGCSVFSNAGGRPPTATNYGPVWLHARAQLWPQGHALASATVYDLQQHAAATMMLRAAVPPAEVARRLATPSTCSCAYTPASWTDERRALQPPHRQGNETRLRLRRSITSVIPRLSQSWHYAAHD